MLDIQLDSTDHFAVTDTQVLVPNFSANSTPSIASRGDTDTGIAFNSAGPRVGIITSSTVRAHWVNTHFMVNDNMAIGWGTPLMTGGVPDLSLYRDDADVLAQRRSTNPQKSHNYMTWTDASNYERLTFDSGVDTANRFAIKTEAAGTGTLRDLFLLRDDRDWETSVQVI